MNKILKISLVTALFSASLFADSYSHLDVKKECDVKSNGVEKVIQTAAKYNEIAIKEKVEFMRFGMKASQYIQSVQDALKNGSKEIELVDEKAKPTGEKVSIEFAACRACSFGISALTQKEQSKKTWKLASPSDGYKY